MSRSELITITIVDMGGSSDMVTRTLSTMSLKAFKEDLQKFIDEAGYRKYEITTTDDVEEFSDEIIEILDEFEVEY